jgi:hypothetical protein
LTLMAGHAAKVFMPACELASRSSKSFTIAKRNRDPITKRIEEIVFPLVILVSHSKAFNLVDQMVFCPSLIFTDFIKSMVGVFHFTGIDIP